MVHSITKNPNDNMLYWLYMAPSSNYLIIMHTSYCMQLIQIKISQIIQMQNSIIKNPNDNMLYWLYMAPSSHKMFSPTSCQTQSDKHD